MAQVAKGKRGSRSKKTSGSKYRSAVSGRYVTAKYGRSSPKTTVRESSEEAKEFSRKFNEQYRDTLRDLSER